MARYSVVVDCMRAQVFAITRQFETTVRHFAGQHEMAVHPGAAITQPSSRLHSARNVASPNRRCEAVVGVVGPLDSILDIREARDGNHRAEHFSADDLIALSRSRNNGRAVVETRAAAGCAAGGYLDVFCGLC